MEKQSKTTSAQIQKLKKQGVEFSQVEFVDIHGILRGKLSGIDYLEKGTTASSALLATVSGDDIPPTPFVRFEYGTEKYGLKPDLSTVRNLSWSNDTAAVICDFMMPNGDPCWADPRYVLRNAQNKVSDMGYETLVGLEMEFFLYHEDEEARAKGRYKDLKPVGTNRHAYSLGRLPLARDFGKDLFRRLKDIGVDLEVFHTEYGVGMYECAFAPLTTLEAADAWVRAKVIIKELAMEHGFVTSFMPVMALNDEDTCTGVHPNVSLWKNGKNAFWDGKAKRISKAGEQFGAGLMASLADAHLLYRPFVNSYRRFDPGAFNPVHVAWGLDNHFASLRLTHGPNPAKQSRWEHRVAGADVSIHLTLASILLAGAYGIQNDLTLPPSVDGIMPDEWESEILSSTLPEATKVFAQSKLMKELFGDEFVEHYALLKEFEWQAFEEWAKENNKDIEPNSRDVTKWEFDRYFEWF